MDRPDPACKNAVPFLGPPGGPQNGTVLRSRYLLATVWCPSGGTAFRSRKWDWVCTRGAHFFAHAGFASGLPRGPLAARKCGRGVVPKTGPHVRPMGPSRRPSGSANGAVFSHASPQARFVTAWLPRALWRTSSAPGADEAHYGPMRTDYWVQGWDGVGGWVDGLTDAWISRSLSWLAV